MKPFRFITQEECLYFTELFAPHIDSWNLLYSSSFVKCKVMPATLPTSLDQAYLLSNQENTPLALISKEYSSFFQWSLFKEIHPTYTSFSEKLSLTLFAKFFAEKVHCLSYEGGEKEWFYRGSPCILVCLYVTQQTLSLYLNPTWVLNKLALRAPTYPPAVPIKTALATKVLPLKVMIEKILLPLAALFELQPGDVITTDHPKSAPLSIQKEGPILWGYLGQTQQFKSIKVVGENNEKTN